MDRSCTTCLAAIATQIAKSPMLRLRSFTAAMRADLLAVADGFVGRWRRGMISRSISRRGPLLGPLKKPRRLSIRPMGPTRVNGPLLGSSKSHGICWSTVSATLFRPGPITGAQDQVPIEDYSVKEFAALLCDGKTLPRDLKTIGIVQRALATLDERTRAVLAQTVLQRQRSPSRSYMYRGFAEALAARWDTTTMNIRRIRRAGISAIAMFVRESSK